MKQCSKSNLVRGFIQSNQSWCQGFRWENNKFQKVVSLYIELNRANLIHTITYIRRYIILVCKPVGVSIALTNAIHLIGSTNIKLNRMLWRNNFPMSARINVNVISCMISTFCMKRFICGINVPQSIKSQGDLVHLPALSGNQITTHTPCPRWRLK